MEKTLSDRLKGKFVIIVAFAITISACTAVDDFNNWRSSCPGFPTFEEAGKVLEENKEMFDQMNEEHLIHDVIVRKCPHGAYLEISHPGNPKRPKMLEIMDEVNAREEGHRMFFGIPFRFVNL